MNREPFFHGRLVPLLGLVLSLVCDVVQAEDRTLQDCEKCPVMVIIPAGKFMMGTTGDASAVPVHQVKLNYQFALGKTEVTEAQFRYFLKRTGYNAGAAHSTPSFSPQQPALEVDWYAASAYARWLSRHTGQRYRLPSEAEWDYAAHGGKFTRYWWGNADADACGKEYLSMTFFRFDQPCSFVKEQEVVDVASLSANPWGLYDMLGNAGEWMLDFPPYDKIYTGAPADGTPYMDKKSQLCVVRGPSFLSVPAPRNLVDPQDRLSNIGFRVLRELP